MKQASIPGVTRSVVVNHTPQPRKEACMYYVGLDLGLRNSSLHILDPDGKLFKAREVRGHWDKVVEEVARLPRPLKVCFEASCGVRRPAGTGTSTTSSAPWPSRWRWPTRASCP